MPTFRGAAALAVAAAALASVAACSDSADHATASVPAPTSGAPCAAPAVPPEGQTLFGVNLDWENDSVADYSDRLGHVPAVLVTFAEVPLDEEQRAAVDAAADQAAAHGASLMLTLEPHAGLDAVTDEVVESLAAALAGYNDRGVPVMLRFAHEMNGSWYAWGQQPQAYVAAFRRVAAAVRARTSATLMVWAPNYGGGYPFSGGEHEAESGSPGHDVLDTDRNGVLTMADDPYAPYYPGDDVVDWVGMSVYHWGTAYPWGENEVPEPGKFVALLTGEYRGEEAVPDFYGEFADRRGKPLSVTETAALYSPDTGGADEWAVKQAWWDQVLDPAVYARLPRLASVNWFEWEKHEVEVGAVVDWGVTREGQLLDGFREALPETFVYAGCEG